MNAGPAPAASGDAPAAVAAPWGGPPLRSTLRFLAVPALLVVAMNLFGWRLEPWALHGFAAIYGTVLLVHSLRDPEWLLAIVVLYLPLSRVYVAKVAPGLNGTNILIVLLLIAWTARVIAERRPYFRQMPGAGPVRWWAALSILSIVTAGFTLGFFRIVDGLQEIKLWIDQFILFFAVLNLIRDGAMARRVMVYMMLGAVVVLALGFQEWTEKRYLETIERARLLGPQMQPNDFGAFLVYSSGTAIALFAGNLTRLRSWLLVPYFLLLARILLATFSRGAYIGMGVAGVAAAFVCGKLFLAVMGGMAVTVLFVYPELLPDSMRDRLGLATSQQLAVEESLDTSSQTRLVLWQAAIEMTKESPLFGKGFKTFPFLKARYTEYDVEESDNHNMFLYISSQMGIPALVAFLLVFYRAFRMGTHVYRSAPDVFGRSIGMGAAAMVAGAIAVNMFGSRMTDMATMAYVWFHIAVVSHLYAEAQAPKTQPTGPTA